MISNQDISLSIAAMSNGTDVPTSGNKLGLNFETGTYSATVTSQQIESNVSKPNRSKGNARRGDDTVALSFNVRLQESEALALLFSSLQSSVQDADGKIKNGVQKVYFMLEAAFVDEDEAANNVFYDRYLGCQVTSINFNIAPSEGIVATVNVMALSANLGEKTASTLTLVPAPDSLEFIGSDVTDVKIEDVDMDEWTSLQITIEQPREAKRVIGSTTPKGNMASAQRNVSGTLRYFKTLKTDSSQFTGLPQKLSFNIGDTFGFMFPSIVCQRPTGDNSPAAIEDEVTWAGGWANEDGCDAEISILKP